MILLDKEGVSSEDGFFILAGRSFTSSEMIASYFDKNFGGYDLVIGVDRGIIEAAIIARVKRVPCGLISYEIFFEEEAGVEFKHPEREACKHIDFAVCQDEVRAGCLSKQNGIPLEKIINIPVAGRSIRLGAKNTYFYDSLGIEKRKEIALFTGHFAGWTMIDYLAESARNWCGNWSMVLHSRGGLDGAARPYYERYKGYNNIYFSLQPVAGNLALIYGQFGLWQKVQPLLRRIAQKPEAPKALEVCRSIIEAHKTNRPDLLAKIPLFVPDKESIELFEIEKKQKRVFSFTDAGQRKNVYVEQRKTSANKRPESNSAFLQKAR